MKKTFIVLIVIVCLIAGIVYVHVVKNQQGQTETVQSDIPTGEVITFELTYRGLSGNEDEYHAYGGWGFGSGVPEDSSFIAAVREKAQNELFIPRNAFLSNREWTAIEYEDKDILYAYFDLNADGSLSDDERLSPVNVSQRNRRGDDTIVFLTPDFVEMNGQEQQVPFRILLWTTFYGDSPVPNVTWCTMGLYEGVATVNDKKVRFYLYPNFGSRSYIDFGSSECALVPVSHKVGDYIPRSKLSSLVLYDKTFYRVSAKATEGDSKTLIVSLIEDKSPCGKIAFNLKGGEDFKYTLNNATIRGSEDKGIYFSIGGGTNELPIGNYAVSSGYVNYGKEDKNDYSTSFRNIPAFAIKADETTTIELGKPTLKIQAVELNKRYHGDKQYKTEFREGTDLYIDASFVGIAGETYSSFDQLVQKENYTTHEGLKAHIKILDGENHEIANQELEYG